MSQIAAEDVLKRLGYFYVEKIDKGIIVEFMVGHIPDKLIHVLTQEKATGNFSGIYAELVQRLLKVAARYSEEGDRMVMLPSSARQEWIADLAAQAKLTAPQLKKVFSGDFQ